MNLFITTNKQMDLTSTNNNDFEELFNNEDENIQSILELSQHFLYSGSGGELDRTQEGSSLCDTQIPREESWRSGQVPEDIAEKIRNLSETITLDSMQPIITKFLSKFEAMNDNNEMDGICEILKSIKGVSDVSEESLLESNNKMEKIIKNFDPKIMNTLGINADMVSNSTDTSDGYEINTNFVGDITDGVNIALGISDSEGSSVEASLSDRDPFWVRSNSAAADIPQMEVFEQVLSDPYDFTLPNLSQSDELDVGELD
ncbi:MAG: hypothetical protein JKX76_01995 [Colwellia sp.]|nr:hypothetical protein [Colwellia sp.]